MIKESIKLSKGEQVFCAIVAICMAWVFMFVLVPPALIKYDKFVEIKNNENVEIHQVVTNNEIK